jgi:hypothetical protein
MKTRFTTVDIITVLEELQPVISLIEQEDCTLFAAVGGTKKKIVLWIGMFFSGFGFFFSVVAASGSRSHYSTVLNIRFGFGFFPESVSGSCCYKIGIQPDPDPQHRQKILLLESQRKKTREEKNVAMGGGEGGISTTEKV